jgi:hypothetical protein
MLMPDADYHIYKGLTENGEWYMDVNEDDG